MLFSRFLVALFVLVSPLAATRVYHGGWCGLSLARDSIDNVEIDFYPGPALGVVYGVQLPNRVRLELEGCFRRQSIDDIYAYGTPLYLPGHIQSLGLFGNVLYELPTCGCAIPFAGAGLGWEYTSTRLNQSEHVWMEGSDSGFAAQLIGGFMFECSDSLSMYVTARYYLFEKNLHSGTLGLGFIYYIR